MTSCGEFLKFRTSLTIVDTVARTPVWNPTPWGVFVTLQSVIVETVSVGAEYGLKMKWDSLFSSICIEILHAVAKNFELRDKEDFYSTHDVAHCRHKR